MNKVHVTVVALILGVSGALGLAAATHTSGLRSTSASPKASNAAIAARARQLDKVERQLARALRNKPPALPAVPASSTPSRSQRPRVVYRRPAPVVLVSSRGHEESEDHESEHEHGGEDD